MRQLLLVAALLAGCGDTALEPAAAQSIFRGETLATEDLPGVWQSSYPVTRSEKTELAFLGDGSVALTREMPDSPVQHLVAAADKVAVVDDIHIISFDVDGALVYKLVLSGWKLQDTRMLFGTMYMYTEGALFNGLRVSFERHGVTD